MTPRHRFTDRGDGDLAAGSAGVDDRRRAVVDLAWTWVHQTHGAGVVEVERPGHRCGDEGDAVVTGAVHAAVGVQVADCAPVALLAGQAVGAVHVGWRGVAAGVVEAAVSALAVADRHAISAVVGPCIGPECYEFGAEDLDAVAGVLGDEVRARTSWGTQALDLPVAVERALRTSGIVDIASVAVCTACSPAHWSHRAGGSQRQALVCWLEP